MTWRKALFFLGFFLVLGFLFGAAYFTPEFISRINADPLTRTDVSATGGKERIFFTIRYATQRFMNRLGLDETELRRYKNGQLFVLSANVHSGSLMDLDLNRQIFLQDSKGREYPSIVKPFVTSNHHRVYLVWVPRYNMEGDPIFEAKDGFFDMLISGGEGIGQTRALRFETPLPSEATQDPKAVLMFLVALSGLLVLSLSPCAVATYSFITYFVASTAGGPRRVWHKVLLFGLGYTSILVLGGGLVLFLSSSLERFPRVLRPFEVAFGLLISGVALKLLISPMERREWGTFKFLEKLLRAEPEGFGAGFWFLSGIALSIGCLQCMGSVGFALLVPLLAYAGLSNLYWGLALFGIFAIGLMAPFLITALGMEEFLPSLTKRVRLVKALQTGSAVILLAFGVFTLLGESMGMTDVMFWVLARLHGVADSAVGVICGRF